jgi:hypothetical protein
VPAALPLTPHQKESAMRKLLVPLFVTALLFGVTAECVAQPAVGLRNNEPAPVPPTVRAINARFAGVWKLVDEDSRDAAGKEVPLPYAASGGRFGYITYDPLGYMGVVLAWAAQPTVSRPEPTVDEAAAALQRYNSYWGSYAVDEAANVVTHQTMGAVMPSFAGTNQQRRFTITGNRLALRPPPAAGGDQRTLTWERVPDLANLTRTHRQLIGFWRLLSFESRNASNQLLASNPGQTGFLVYTASGHVMLHLMQPYRRRDVGSAPTPDETMATYRSYASYFGPYTVDEATGVVVHHLDASFNSAAPGTDLELHYGLPGRRLTLKTPATKDSDGQEGHETMTWERLSD